jgi:enterochelin esterase-like enzyme
MRSGSFQRACLSVGVALSIALAVAPPRATAESPAAVELHAGMRLERALDAAGRDVYVARLESGTAILAQVDQHGIDVAIDVVGPDGKQLRRFDSPNGAEGPEPIDFTAPSSGTYSFVVHVLDDGAKPGRYVMAVDRFVAPAENAVRLAKLAYTTPAIYDLWAASRDDPAAADALAAKLQTPIIEAVSGNAAEMRVTFVYRGDADTQSVVLSGGPDYFGVHLRRIGRTNVFFGTELVRKDARFAYSFDAREVHYAGAKGDVAVEQIVQTPFASLAMPDAPAQPYLAVRAGIPHGTLSAATVASTALGERRDVAVYTPPGYDGSVAQQLLVVLDGEVYGGVPGQSAVPGPAILDNLLAEKKIRPTVAVFVDTMGKRNRDLTGSAPFADFIARELVPWARVRYRVSPGAASVTIAGSSFGGFAASHAAFSHPDAIGNVISQSGSYWLTKDWRNVRPPYPHDTGMLIEAFRDSKKLPIRFYLEVGRYDLGAAMLGSNRELRDVLLVKGYDVDYHEFDGGHQYAYWRGSFADGLVAILGYRPSQRSNQPVMRRATSCWSAGL